MNKTAIVTGGSRGIGAAIVNILVKEGYNVVLNYNTSEDIAKKMKEELNSAIGDYRIYYNNLDPIIYTKLNEDYIELTIRYLAHPKKARHIESQIWNKIYESQRENKLKLYTTKIYQNWFILSINSR